LQSFFFDASNNRVGNDIHMDVVVYIEENNTFYVPNRPEKAAGVSLSIVNSSSDIVLEKQIYVTLSFEFRPPSHSGYHLNFFNNYPSAVLVMVSVERLNKTVETIQEAHLDPLSQTLKGVIDEMQTVPPPQTQSFNE